MKLSDAIWVTRKCHINAERRLSHANLTANVAMTAYSFYLVVASVAAMRLNLPHFEIVSLAGAVLVLTASVFIWGLRFADRAAQFKASYLRLQLLCAESEAAESANDAGRIETIRRSYTEVLQGCENHAPSDYHELCYELRNAEKKTVPSLTKWEQFEYVTKSVGRSLGRVFLVVAPALVLVFFYA